MNILVTGGAGFIASHIVDSLVELGHHVAILDNFSTGHDLNINSRAHLYRQDILDDQTIRIFEEFKPEVVIHHAAQIDVQASMKNPSLDARVNIVGTIKMLEACRDSGVRKFIYASSAAVYGNPQYLPIDEKHPISPLSSYGISKHTPEHYLQIFSNQYGLDYTILRYSNAYGIRQEPKGEGGVVSIFINKILNQQQPIIYGDGEQTRDFIYVKDIAKANIAALKLGSKGIYNISSNETTSVNTLLRILSVQCSDNIIPSYKEMRSSDIRHSCLDNSAAMKELNWEPEYTLADGLIETFNYYRNLYTNLQI